ncbi:MAG: hypothetical protein P8076_12265 [Gammaproteobacteria bacterium]
MKGIYLDPETTVVEEGYAVVYAPRRQRERFPENVVEVVASERDARAAADADRHRYAAVVFGPSRSSEGLRLYYLVRWLD